MCIIVSKPHNVPMPDIKILKQCWQNNSDGAGFSYVRPNDRQVTIIKGFMKYKQFFNAVESARLGTKDVVVFHFRFATHGLVDGGNCHPFPVSTSPDDLRSLNIKTAIAVAHNGIFGKMPNHSILSDTQKFVSKIMANRYLINGLNNTAIQELLRGYCGDSSKLAILTPRTLLHIGKFINDQGILYSNSGYKPYVYYNSTGWDAKDNQTVFGKTYSPTCAYCESKHLLEYHPELSVSLCPDCALYHNIKD